MSNTVYDSMNDKLNELRITLSADAKVEGEHTLLKLPQLVIDYLDTRRSALSNAACRAQDSAALHLTWMQYHANMASQSPVVDSVAWELLYNELSSSYDITVSALHCIRLGLSDDPARPYIRIGELKDSIDDMKTTPEFIAYANDMAEDLELDLTELLPPVIALEIDDVTGMNELAKQLFGSEAPDFLDAILSVPSGNDVDLA
jgi:hypothetical protein